MRSALARVLTGLGAWCLDRAERLDPHPLEPERAARMRRGFVRALRIWDAHQERQRRAGAAVR